MNFEDFMEILRSLGKVACIVLVVMNVSFGLLTLVFGLYSPAYYFFSVACFMGAAAWFLEFFNPDKRNLK